MRVFTVKEQLKDRVHTTICNDFNEASRLMLKINSKGGKSTMSSFEHDFDQDSGNINTSRPTLSPEQRRYNRTGRL